jgi:hypothetical protein
LCIREDYTTHFFPELAIKRGKRGERKSENGQLLPFSSFLAASALIPLCVREDHSDSFFQIRPIKREKGEKEGEARVLEVARIVLLNPTG